MGSDDDSEDFGAALARAQAAVAALSRDYQNWARADLDHCRRHLAAARNEPEHRPKHVEALFGVAHNIKGQGASFGYPLMTQLGQSLCQLTRQTQPFGDAALALADAHLEVMAAVLDQEARDDGTEVLRAKVAELENAVALL
jgi:HPt (histidine-containing phosphotransfer) domain-containing protein